MRSESVRYSLYNMDGQHQFTGTVSECAEYLGCTKKQFTNGYSRYQKYKQHMIEKEHEPTDAEVIKAWDDFVIPLRKKYGIPVYKPEKGVRR